ncbi:hypothetical protein BN1708_010785, partial [Verticillium longisporum]
ATECQPSTLPSTVFEQIHRRYNYKMRITILVELTLAVAVAASPLTAHPVARTTAATANPTSSLCTGGRVFVGWLDKPFGILPQCKCPKSLGWDENRGRCISPPLIPPILRVGQKIICAADSTLYCDYDKDNDLCLNNTQNVVLAVVNSISKTQLKKQIQEECKKKPKCPAGQTWTEKDKKCKSPCLPKESAQKCKAKGGSPICAKTPKEYCNYDENNNLCEDNGLNILQCLVPGLDGTVGAVENILDDLFATIGAGYPNGPIDTGLVIRAAQSIGLHRDGKMLGLSPFESEIRRRLWWYIVCRDGRAAEDYGLENMRRMTPGCAAGIDMPLNVHDSDLYPEMDELPPNRPGWTSMTLSLIAIATVLGWHENAQSTPTSSDGTRSQVIQDIRARAKGYLNGPNRDRIWQVVETVFGDTEATRAGSVGAGDLGSRWAVLTVLKEKAFARRAGETAASGAPRAQDQTLVATPGGMDAMGVFTQMGNFDWVDDLQVLPDWTTLMKDFQMENTLKFGV